jgi:hypothetical protein
MISDKKIKGIKSQVELSMLNFLGTFEVTDEIKEFSSEVVEYIIRELYNENCKRIKKFDIFGNIYWTDCKENRVKEIDLYCKYCGKKIEVVK